MKIVLNHKYDDLVSIDNLLLAWTEFVKGKRNKKDVQEFQFNLMDNILSLHQDLINKTYKHGGYQQFKINDPKPRIIHKATVRDRLLHHAIYRILYPFFDKKFIADSFSCRNNKGTHKAINRFRKYAYVVSKNNTKPCWILKCDIKKFFTSVDQSVLVKILEKHFRLSYDNQAILNLLSEIIYSFKPNGLPLGNLTSQLFANVYLNELDQFVKHKLRIKYYIRYADDFVIFSEDKKYLEYLIPIIEDFLQNELKLTLHPDKVFIKTLSSGVDFLGWMNFFDHRVLRKTTKKRMLKRIKDNFKPETINSYLGLLKHGNAHYLSKNVEFW
jgi:RNA-directed DNA polymerase